MKKLLEVNTCPDFIEDKGHYFGHQLSDDDKSADRVHEVLLIKRQQAG